MPTLKNKPKTQQAPLNVSLGMGGDSPVAVKRVALSIKEGLEIFKAEQVKQGESDTDLEAFCIVASRSHGTSRQGIFIIDDFYRDSSVFEDRIDYSSLVLCMDGMARKCGTPFCFTKYGLHRHFSTDLIL